jgi:nitrite reductase/ring-hydroxylating ferredoxin subunit
MPDDGAERPDHAEQRAARRVDRLVSGLLAGKRLRAKAGDAPEQETIRSASQLAGSREGYPRMSAAFRERLAARLSGEEPRRQLTRRDALVAAVAAAGGIAVGGALERILGVGAPAPAPARPSSRGVLAPKAGTGRWIDVGLALEELQEGVPVRVNAGSIGVFVTRWGNEVRAMSAFCTHQPCELAWIARDRVLNCPCHNVDFSPEGNSVSPTYPLPPLPLARTRVVAGRVEVLGT